jgi:hypothetical protein
MIIFLTIVIIVQNIIVAVLLYVIWSMIKSSAASKMINMPFISKENAEKIERKKHEWDDLLDDSVKTGKEKPLKEMDADEFQKTHSDLFKHP